jgi:hypothetical protein
MAAVELQTKCLMLKYMIECHPYATLICYILNIDNLIYSMLSNSPFLYLILPRPQRPRTPNLPPPPKIDTTKLILVVPSHVSILIDIPALALSRARRRVFGSRCNLTLGFFPLLLAFAFALHLALEQRHRGFAQGFCLCLGGCSPRVFATLFGGRCKFGSDVRRRLQGSRCWVGGEEAVCSAGLGVGGRIWERSS